jgi:glycerol-3-phosphate acyltransferase PlsY
MLHASDWSLALPYAALGFVIGYLFGSIPFGVILTRLAGTADLRTIGSGNIGATNVLRTGNKALAAATLAGDMLKGTVAVVICQRLWGHEVAIIAALGAFIGHLFPVWLGFRGGKGVATYIGLLLGLGLWAGLFAFCGLWAIIAALSRYSSLAALIASAATPPVLWLSGAQPEAQLFGILSLLLWLKHAANIRRLATGHEGRIGR